MSSGGTARGIYFSVDDDFNKITAFLSKIAERFDYIVSRGPTTGSGSIGKMLAGVYEGELMIVRPEDVKEDSSVWKFYSQTKFQVQRENE